MTDYADGGIVINNTIPVFTKIVPGPISRGHDAPYYYFDVNGNVRMTETTVGAINSCVTLEQVLEWLPTWMRADFDCPNRGPHSWLPRITTRGNHYTFCRNCNRVKR